ncbi:MAG: ATP-binding protein [Verrucomicrobia bacterium]|nr:MAG: ATP-binding protein [Verrucomicrobiota bacterium]
MKNNPTNLEEMRADVPTPPEPGPCRSEQRRLSVLVLGDLVVDEHWVTGIERSPTASRRGLSHSHALHALNTTVDTLSGAGLTASVLARAGLNPDGSGTPLCEVHAIGVWHPSDQRVLRAMMIPQNTQGRSPYKVSWPFTEYNLDYIHLHNLAPFINDAESPYATTTVIRVYERTANDGVRLQKRIDWELHPHAEVNGSPSWIKAETDLEKLLKPIGSGQVPLPEIVDAIIIKDLVKGVVTEKMIEWLVNVYGEKRIEGRPIPWFISSKAFKPGWLKKLHNQHVQLLVIPPVAAQEAARRNETSSSWCVAQGVPSPHALELLESQDRKLQKLFPPGQDRLVLALPVPERTCVIAKSCEGKSEPWLLVQPDYALQPPRVGVPMASVLFGALVALTIKHRDRTHRENLDIALDFTKKWMEHQSMRIESPDGWKPEEEPVVPLDVAPPNPSRLRRDEWHLAVKTWKQAYSFISRGIIEHGGLKQIELWRAMTDVDRYVSLTKSKRSAIRSLGLLLDRYKECTDERPLSAMLLARPGSGKTYLMSKLAAQHGFDFLSFNVAQMLQKSDLFDAFDTIVSTRAAQLHPEKPTLVFFDEINVELESSPVYTVFLDPIDCSTYRRAGKAFHIPRCLWVFAGTGIDESRRETKGSDFKSRLTLGPINFDAESDDADSDDAKLERIYLGVSMLKQEFPEVRFVSKKVLEAFAHLKP